MFEFRDIGHTFKHARLVQLASSLNLRSYDFSLGNSTAIESMSTGTGELRERATARRTLETWIENSEHELFESTDSPVDIQQPPPHAVSYWFDRPGLSLDPYIVRESLDCNQFRKFPGFPSTTSLLVIEAHPSLWVPVIPFGPPSRLNGPFSCSARTARGRISKKFYSLWIS
jgi:hypothetical protein